MILTNGETKERILRAGTFDEVDEILNTTHCETVADKLAYLKLLFGVEVIFDGDGGEDDYTAVVNTILTWL